MQYPVTIEHTKEDNFVVSFTDIPNASTQGKTYEEAMENAKDCLHTALEFYYEKWEPFL
jgi:antitoxin HicB